MNPEIERLAKKITPERFEKMKRVLENRTRKITVVLEDIFQPHNASAVLRNCDAFGLQDATFIENKYLHRESRSVDMGAGKWLTVRRFVCGEAVVPKNGMPRKHLVSAAAEENTLRAISDLRSRGYKLVASTLRGGAGGLDEIPVNEPLALLIGTERLGLERRRAFLRRLRVFDADVGLCAKFQPFRFQRALPCQSYAQNEGA